MLYNIPIEPLEERYSVQWAKWFQEHFDSADVPHTHITGNATSGVIKDGAFLDVVETHVYKAYTILSMLERIQSGKVHDDDVFFFHDIWDPGLTTLAYVRDGLGLNFKIAGCLHAGSYDCNDFLARKGMTSWAASCEFAWFREIADAIFVATPYHKRLICGTRQVDPSGVHVTGFPMYPDDFVPKDIHWDIAGGVGRPPRLAFPHRLDPEKHPELLHELAVRLPNWNIIVTKKFCNSKKKYYETLQACDAAVSFADQETWGIAMQEALFCGAIPFVPNRLSYVEMYPDELRYKDMDDLVNKLTSWWEYRGPMVRAAFSLEKAGRQAIGNMITIMRAKGWNV